MKKLLLVFAFIFLPFNLFAQTEMDYLEPDLDIAEQNIPGNDTPAPQAPEAPEAPTAPPEPPAPQTPAPQPPTPSQDMQNTDQPAIKDDRSSAAGEWYTIDDKTGKRRSIITIYEEKGLYYGKITKSLEKDSDGPKVCNNCPGDMNGKPTIGLRFMWDFKPDGDGRYSGGRIIDPENGDVYQANMRLKDNGEKLQLRGYVGIPLFGRSQIWERVN